MSQLVVLNFGKGNWQQGFPTVIAQLWETDSRTPMKVTGSLPPAPELPELYSSWQKLYEALSERLAGGCRYSDLAIEFDEEDITQVSEAEFNRLCQQLERQINTWLDSGSFRNIERRLRTKLTQLEEIRVIIETEDEQLRRFPWHLWSFFEDYPHSEFALSIQEYERVKTPQKKAGQIRVLAILGNSQGIDVQTDREMLEQLPNAETVFLVEPQSGELEQLLWDETGWDILFFAGHSSTHADGVTGKMEINPHEVLTIPQLKYALRAAIVRGLHLAIFNSCDGLGLARQLADLHIPQLIVMREPVPDFVAQEFLKHFLKVFAGGKSFYLAVREAKEKLQGLEGQYPCACWLPVICQNPATLSPTWQELRPSPEEPPVSPPNSEGSRVPISLVSLVTAGLVIGVRLLGILQPLELMAFDHLMQLRPDEGIDERLLLVTVTAADVQAQPELGNQARSLSNRALAQLLEKLKQYQPRVIGLDIYRDFPVESEYQSLINRFREDDRFITICQSGDSQHKGRKPSPDIPRESQPGRVGFSDVVVDKPHGIVRRHLLSQDMEDESISPCQSRLSFSLLTALRYLFDDGIEGERTEAGDWQIGDVVFPTLEKKTAGYQQLDAAGDQILLNYRSSADVARQVTLSQVLNDEIDPSWVKERIVLIGTTDSRFGDLLLTPYHQQVFQEIPGVFVQAHMVSQIISAVKDGRRLLWWLPQLGEAVWIVAWSVVGGLIAWRCRSLVVIGLATGMTIIILYGVCYVVLFLFAGWIPLVPSALALVAASGSVSVYQAYRT